MSVQGQTRATCFFSFFFKGGLHVIHSLKKSNNPNNILLAMTNNTLFACPIFYHKKDGQKVELGNFRLKKLFSTFFHLINTFRISINQFLNSKYY
jgi:hypothetical protein